MSATQGQTTGLPATLDDMDSEELRALLANLAAQMDKTVRHLEHATKALASIGAENGRYLGWFHDIRRAAGHTQPGTSHADLIASIRGMNQRQLEGAHH